MTDRDHSGAAPPCAPVSPDTAAHPDSLSRSDHRPEPATPGAGDTAWIRATDEEADLFNTLRELPPEVRIRLTAALNAARPPAHHASGGHEALRNMVLDLEGPVLELREGIDTLQLVDVGPEKVRGVIAFIERGLHASLKQVETAYAAGLVAWKAGEAGA